MGVTPTPWKTKEAVELATLEWVFWFKHHRLLEPIGHVPPAEFEANYHRQLAESAVSAWLTPTGLHDVQGGLIRAISTSPETCQPNSRRQRTRRSE
jgi:hypothetical protein